MKKTLKKAINWLETKLSWTDKHIGKIMLAWFVVTMLLPLIISGNMGCTIQLAMVFGFPLVVWRHTVVGVRAELRKREEYAKKGAISSKRK